MPRNDSLCYFFDEKCGLAPRAHDGYLPSLGEMWVPGWPFRTSHADGRPPMHDSAVTAVTTRRDKAQVGELFANRERRLTSCPALPPGIVRRDPGDGGRNLRPWRPCRPENPLPANRFFHIQW